MGPILWVSFHRKHILGVGMWFYGGSNSRPYRGVDTLTVAGVQILCRTPFKTHKMDTQRVEYGFQKVSFRRTNETNTGSIGKIRPISGWEYKCGITDRRRLTMPLVPTDLALATPPR